MQSQTAKSARPQYSTPQGSRSQTSARMSQKPKPILYRLRRFCKRINWARIGALLLILLVLSLSIYGAVSFCHNIWHKDTEPEAQTPEDNLSSPEPTGYIFKYGEGYAVDMEQLTDAWAAEAGFEKRYTLTDDERLEIAQVITAEAAGEPFAGKVAVAQCILQTCEDADMRPHEVLSMYSYSKRRPEPTEEALEAVAAVFDFGHMATSEPIKYFYAPALTDSEWHESQVYVMTINGHKFFKEADNDAGDSGK